MRRLTKILLQSSMVAGFLPLFLAIFLAGPAPIMAETDPAVRILSVSIEKRKVVGERTIRVTQGDRVQLNWQTDEKVELHLHGIDQKTEVLPGSGGTMRFTAKATGRFPVTSHGFGNEAGHHHGPGALMYVEVYPK